MAGSHGVRLLLITGSTRRGSTNTAGLRAAHDSPPAGTSTVLHTGLADLPAFNPDDDHHPLPTPVVRLRRRIAAADAVVFCTPEYAGALPGSFKNLLDWTVGGAEIYGKPVAWLNVAAPGRGELAHKSLATVLGYVGAHVLDDACARIQVPRSAVGPGGGIVAPELVDAIRRFVADVAVQVRTHAPAG